MEAENSAGKCLKIHSISTNRLPRICIFELHWNIILHFLMYDHVFQLYSRQDLIFSWQWSAFCPQRAHPASCTIGTGSFLGVKSGRGVLLTTHSLLVPLSWKRRAIPLPTLWATTRPVTGTQFFISCIVFILICTGVALYCFVMCRYV